MTRRARGFGAPSRIGIALLLVALAFAAAMAGGYGDNPVYAQTTIDYDDDNDGLIDVRSLAQLDAIRHDLDGNGDPSSGGATAYGNAFPNRVTTSSGRMGCPSGTCSGYELRAHLDFDTDGDGVTYIGTGSSASGDSGDDYYNSNAGFARIGSDSGGSQFNATFKGNGYAISNLFIRSANTGENDRGLFGATSSSARIESVFLVNPYVRGNLSVGALVGSNRGTVTSSYTSGGQVYGFSNVGGLVGYNYGTIRATYSTTAAGGAAGPIAGLIGRQSTGANVSASYAAGGVTVDAGSSRFGFLGQFGGQIGGSVANSYWDTNATGIADDGDSNMPEGKTRTKLQSVTSYTDIYANWNVDVDATSGNDDPWDFGASDEYPALKFGGMNPTIQRGDYDLDDDGLIEITTLAQLNAVRHDVDGNGDPASGSAAAYSKAFLNRNSTASARMGCPSGTCSGYELAAHLDFDTDGDGSTYDGTGTSATGDSGDAYYNDGDGWAPIGTAASQFSATFKGNGYVISNLFIKRTAATNVGLFGRASPTARFESVGLYNAYVYGNGRVGRAQRGFGRRVLLHRLGSRRTGRRHRRLGRMVGEHRRLGTRNGVVFHGGGLYPQHRIPRRLGRSNGGRHPRLRQLLHRNGNDPRAQQRRRLRGRRRLYRRQRRDNHRVLLGLDHKRQSRRRRQQPARRQDDRRPEGRDGLYGHIRRLERGRGRRIGR